MLEIGHHRVGVDGMWRFVRACGGMRLMKMAVCVGGDGVAVGCPIPIECDRNGSVLWLKSVCKGIG